MLFQRVDGIGARRAVDDGITNFTTNFDYVRRVTTPPLRYTHE